MKTVIAKVIEDGVEYRIEKCYDYYHLITIDKEFNRSVHESLDEVYEAIDWFDDTVADNLKAQCEYFQSDEGQKEFAMSDKIKSPTQTITVCEIEDTDGNWYKIKMVPGGWKLIVSGDEHSQGRYVSASGVFNNLRGRCSRAAYKALVAQYKQLKSRFEYEPYIPQGD